MTPMWTGLQSSRLKRYARVAGDFPSQSHLPFPAFSGSIVLPYYITIIKVYCAQHRWERRGRRNWI